MQKPIFPATGLDTAHAATWGLIAAFSSSWAFLSAAAGCGTSIRRLFPMQVVRVFRFRPGLPILMWLRRPPTRLYWFRGWHIFFERRHFLRDIFHLGHIVWNNIVMQRFIDRRSHMRWTAHWFLAWGCLLAAAVTFPLSFGWVRFETAMDNQQIYRAFMFGIPLGSFRLGTWIAELTFNILDVAAVMVLIGLFFALWRRGRDRGAMSVQQFSNDLTPLIMLFAICVTGASSPFPPI